MLAYFIVATGVLLLAYELVRRSAWAAGVGFLLVPICLTPYWLRVSQFHADLFPWVKLYSVLVGTCWICAIRFTALGQRRWTRRVLFLLFVVNILEAIVRDCLSGTPANYLNAAAGLLLVATLPSGLDTMVVDALGPHRDLHWGIPLPWIVGYTLWNWVFLYANYPQHAVSQSAVLAAALIAGVIMPERWLQARAMTLAICLMAGFTFPSFLATYANTQAWGSAEGRYAGALASLGFMLLYTGSSFASHRLVPGRRPNRGHAPAALAGRDAAIRGAGRIHIHPRTDRLTSALRLVLWPKNRRVGGS